MPQEKEAKPGAGNEERAAKARKSGPKKSARKKVATKQLVAPRARKKAAPRKRATRKAARRKRTARGRRYTPAERARILAVARREGLSGPAASKKFGISQLTFYTWRKKAGAPKRRGRRPGGARPVGRPNGLGSAITSEVRHQIQERVLEMLPGIIREEIASALGTKAGRGRR